MADEIISIIKEECTLDEIISELPNRVAKPAPTVKGKTLSFSKFFHQISDSLKDLPLVYTCLDVSSVVIALGTNVGNAFIYHRSHRNISKISSDTKYVPTTCIKLAAGCDIVAFAHESGTFSVGFVDPPIHRSFDSLTAQEIHHKAVTCLEWSADGLILYAGDCEGNISMSVVKITEGILQTAMIFKEDGAVVQLSYMVDALLVSTTKRTLVWPFNSEEKIQVGEKERKTTGCFGGCFIPESLQEPSKKLYAARPGHRIWAADKDGKVSSTSVFKSLLGDKPQAIYTLSGNDGKMNSGGQFGQLLIYYKKFVVTWDQTHLWVFDLTNGVVVGCHSNLGKICDVAVSGHELFVLLNQREKFLQRFTLINENLGPTTLDAVIAIPEAEANKSKEAEKPTEKEARIGSVLTVTVPEPETSDQADKIEITAPVVDDVFQRINAISLDCEKDIVFNATKKKKKKKKVKQAHASDETKNAVENQETSDLKIDRVFSPENENTTSTRDITVEDTSGFDSPPQGSKTEHEGSPKTPEANLEILPKVLKVEPEGLGEVPKAEPEQLPKVSKTYIAQDGSASSPQGMDKLEANRLASDQITGRNEQTVMNAPMADKEVDSVKQPIMPGNGENLQPTLVDSGEVTTNDQETENTSSNHFDTHTSQRIENATIQPLNEGFMVTNDNLKEVHKVANEGQEVETSDQVPDKLDIDFPEIKSGASSETETMSPSADSGDEFRILEGTSNYLRNDSYEPNLPETLSEISRSDQLEPKQDPHAPLFADTWSKRDLPTTQTIESLAISEHRVFCVNARGTVYYSDPGTASCHGWEEVDWKAKQIYVDDKCGLVSYLGKNNKVYIRTNVSSMHPLGSKSLLLLEDVTALASCSECSWTIMANGGVRKANTLTLLELKSDLKNPKIWSEEDSTDKLCQVACYHGVVWGRTLDDTLCVYTGRCDGKKISWIKDEEQKAKWLNMSDDGTVWIITPDGDIWFKSGISSTTPTGEVWYKVTLGQYIIDDPSVLGSAFNFFYTVGSAYRMSRTTEYLRHAAKGLIQSTKDMATSLFKYAGNPKQIYCNTQSGVWLLDTSNALHACRGQVTGAYWKRICPTGTAQSAKWHEVSTGLGSFVWALQPNGELTCFDPKGPSYNVEGPSTSKTPDFLSSSPYGVWCFASASPHRIYIRDGISSSFPQGFAWVALPLSLHEITSVRHISVGRITVWAVDNRGNPWIRIGTVCGDDSSVLSQAWVPIDAPPNAELSRIEVNPKDDMVWATDTRGNVYARDGVKDDFLVGTSWREVSGTLLKSVCLSSYAVYGLCTNDEIVCRFGVSSSNCIGDYWKKIPGEFAQISINDAGELWGITHENWLYARKTKCLLVKSATKEIAEKGGDYKSDNKENVVSQVDGVKDDEDEGEWELL